MSRAERLREQLKGEIADAAFAEFAERGYHQTKIADIAKRLGIGHGTFYLHFRSKREILDYVVDGTVRRVLEVIGAENAPDAATSLDEIAEQALRIGEAVGAMIDADPRVARLMLFEATSIDAELTERLLGLYDLAVQLTEGYLENGVRRGFLRADLDTAASADALGGLTLALIIRVLRSPMDVEERRRRHRETIRLMLDGMRS
jgi:AcrR family transcriptional regulator